MLSFLGKISDNYNMRRIISFIVRLWIMFFLMSFVGCDKIPSIHQTGSGQDTVVVADTLPVVQGKDSSDVKKEVQRKSCSLYKGLKRSHFLRDPNKMHIRTGMEMGMKKPFRKNADFLAVRDSILGNNILKYVEDGVYYKKKEMRYSYPYLIPEAIVLLDEISTRFHEKLMKKNMNSYSLQVTSCLRTMESQSQLRNSNLNATKDTTSHCFGASFDISYWEFIENETGELRRYRNLQKILTQTIREIRNEKKCLVIKETGQFCFHCTVIQ
jgi:hypothetical protein